MSETIRPYRKGGWEVDISVVTPGARRARERKLSPLSSKTAALRSRRDSSKATRHSGCICYQYSAGGGSTRPRTKTCSG